MEVLKLISNVGSTAPEYVFEVKESYTFADMNTITLEARMD
jgi:hypothetical protein